uniref:Uncharacterized protein n=1 Tax=Avena sativa TaxID=4498 RepID=A0ACD5WQL5_AVESA
MSRERKKAAALHEKMQILRSITHSHALSSTSIIMDASEYIKELKQKVARLNQEIARGEEATTNSHNKENSFPTVHTLNTYTDTHTPLAITALCIVLDLGSTDPYPVPSLYGLTLCTCDRSDHISVYVLIGYSSMMRDDSINHCIHLCR